MSSGTESPMMDSRSGSSKLESRKDKTLVCGIQNPKNCGLWTQEIQVPLPDGEEGSFGCIGESLI